MCCQDLLPWCCWQDTRGMSFVRRIPDIGRLGIVYTYVTRFGSSISLPHRACNHPYARDHLASNPVTTVLRILLRQYFDPSGRLLVGIQSWRQRCPLTCSHLLKCLADAVFVCACTNVPLYVTIRLTHSEESWVVGKQTEDKKCDSQATDGKMWASKLPRPSSRQRLKISQ